MLFILLLYSIIFCYYLLTSLYIFSCIDFILNSIDICASLIDFALNSYWIVLICFDFVLVLYGNILNCVLGVVEFY